MESRMWERDLLPPTEEAKPSIEQWHREEGRTMNVCAFVNPVLVKERTISESIQGVVGGLQWMRNQLLVNLYAMKTLSALPTGWLQLLIPNWKLITQDPWVLENVLGHRLELTEPPVQRTAPEEPHLSPELEACMQEELSKPVQKGAITLVPNSYPRSFISRMFLVPKKDGSYRPIVDLQELNRFI